MSQEQKLNFYATPPHDCNYLPNKSATTLFADPHFEKNNRLYSALADCGFRRSGEHLYTPHCDDCSSCVPVRIPVNEFQPSRNQKRTWKRNQNIIVTRQSVIFSEEHFALYKKYLSDRHTGGGMDDPTPDSYMQFLTASWAKTYFYEMRLADEDNLIAVATVDVMENALSAVYTFFDPDYSHLSPGRFAVLFEIEEAKRLHFDSLYLGYWIKDCKKMNYKDEYQPLEYYRNNNWFREP
jgi:leucyl-tRNA---protein transferase